MPDNRGKNFVFTYTLRVGVCAVSGVCVCVAIELWRLLLRNAERQRNYQLIAYNILLVRCVIFVHNETNHFTTLTSIESPFSDWKKKYIKTCAICDSKNKVFYTKLCTWIDCTSNAHTSHHIIPQTFVHINSNTHNVWEYQTIFQPTKKKVKIE